MSKFTRNQNLSKSFPVIGILTSILFFVHAAKMKDEWEIEMGRMLDIIEHESEASLRKINDRFEALDRPFNEAFRQYVKKMSEHRYESN